MVPCPPCPFPAHARWTLGLGRPFSSPSLGELCPCLSLPQCANVGSRLWSSEYTSYPSVCLRGLNYELQGEWGVGEEGDDHSKQNRLQLDEHTPMHTHTQTKAFRAAARTPTRSKERHPYSRSSSIHQLDLKSPRGKNNIPPLLSTAQPMRWPGINTPPALSSCLAQVVAGPG